MAESTNTEQPQQAHNGDRPGDRERPRRRRGGRSGEDSRRAKENNNGNNNHHHHHNHHHGKAENEASGGKSHHRRYHRKSRAAQSTTEAVTDAPQSAVEATEAATKELAAEELAVLPSSLVDQLASPLEARAQDGDETLMAAAAVAMEQDVTAVAAETPEAPVNGIIMSTQEPSSSPLDHVEQPLPEAVEEEVELDVERTLAENPYVSVVAKKIRALKKKLSKISALEKKVTETANNALNEDQTELLNSKERVQQALADNESLKTHFEEIAAAELTDSKQPKRALRPKESPAKPAAVQTEAYNPQRQAVERLLKLVHVVAKGALPTELDYFCKSIIGTAGLPDDEFHHALQHSVAAAMLYLESSQAEISQGVTYAKLERIIEIQAEQIATSHANAAD